MAECPDCGMRDDDWFLCRRDPCAVKAGSDELARLRSELERVKGERDELRQGIAGKDRRMYESVTHGQYLEMAETLHAAVDGGRNRAEAAEARIAGLEAAGNAVLASWDERMPDGPETFKTSDELGFSYWSPSASMVSSEAMSKLRAALEGGDNA